MGKVLLFSMGCFFAPFTKLFGQSSAYQSIFTTQSQWNLSVLQYATGTKLQTVQKIIKDTMMSGQTHRVFAEDATVLARKVYLKEDSLARKVYVFEDNETRLLYDFNLKKGERFKFKELEFEAIEVSDIQLPVGTLKRIELKCLTKLADFLIWIEGVGATSSPLYYKHYASPDIDVKVTCCFRNQQLVYSLSDFPCTLPVGTDDESKTKLNVDVFPNPFADDLKIKVKNPENESFKLQLFSIIGVELYNQIVSADESDFSTDFNTKQFPSGIYILKVTSPKGTITRKVIKK
jgi:hypothetical protein